MTKIVKNTKNGKSTGIDHLPYEVYLKYYFQLCFDSGYIPDQWLKAIISPIPKASYLDRYSPLNYRGISLLCACAKLYSSLINKRLSRHLESQQILADEQNGF